MSVAEEIGNWYSTYVDVVVSPSDSGYRCRVGLSQYENRTARDMETDQKFLSGQGKTDLGEPSGYQGVQAPSGLPPVLTPSKTLGLISQEDSRRIWVSSLRRGQAGRRVLDEVCLVV
jgi:hypothetical protein